MPPSSLALDVESGEDAEARLLLQKQNGSSSAKPLSSYVRSASTPKRQAFYDRQNALIESLQEVQTIAEGGDVEKDAEADAAEERHTQLALNLSFASNFLLLIIRVAVAVLSGSLSLLVTTLDAVLDVISGAIIWTTERASKQRNKYKYPVGKGRMAPLGVVVFSSIMGTAGASIIMEGVAQLASHKDAPQASVPILIIIGAAVGVIVMKGAMWLMCRSSTNPSVQAFALDHLNDVVVNATGLVGVVLGQYVAWWLDPAVAIAMSVWLIWAWGGQAYEQLMALVGMAAPPDLLQKLTYLAFQHAQADVKQIDTVRAYSFGPESWLVEVDVVLPGDMPLKQAHDIGEGLQAKLEKLPEVARAYVHLDYEADHSPEFEHKEL